MPVAFLIHVFQTSPTLAKSPHGFHTCHNTAKLGFSLCNKIIPTIRGFAHVSLVTVATDCHAPTAVSLMLENIGVNGVIKPFHAFVIRPAISTLRKSSTHPPIAPPTIRPPSVPSHEPTRPPTAIPNGLLWLQPPYPMLSLLIHLQLLRLFALHFLDCLRCFCSSVKLASFAMFTAFMPLPLLQSLTK